MWLQSCQRYCSIILFLTQSDNNFVVIIWFCHLYIKFCWKKLRIDSFFQLKFLQVLSRNFGQWWMPSLLIGVAVRVFIGFPFAFEHDKHKSSYALLGYVMATLLKHIFALSVHQFHLFVNQNCICLFAWNANTTHDYNLIVCFRSKQLILTWCNMG